MPASVFLLIHTDPVQSCLSRLNGYLECMDGIPVPLMFNELAPDPTEPNKGNHRMHCLSAVP